MLKIKKFLTKNYKIFERWVSPPDFRNSPLVQISGYAPDRLCV